MFYRFGLSMIYTKKKNYRICEVGKTDCLIGDFLFSFQRLTKERKFCFCFQLQCSSQHYLCNQPTFVLFKDGCFVGVISIKFPMLKNTAFMVVYTENLRQQASQLVLLVRTNLILWSEMHLFASWLQLPSFVFGSAKMDMINLSVDMKLLRK